MSLPLYIFIDLFSNMIDSIQMLVVNKKERRKGIKMINSLSSFFFKFCSWSLKTDFLFLSHQLLFIFLFLNTHQEPQNWDSSCSQPEDSCCLTSSQAGLLHFLVSVALGSCLALNPWDSTLIRCFLLITDCLTPPPVDCLVYPFQALVWWNSWWSY